MKFKKYFTFHTFLLLILMAMPFVFLITNIIGADVCSDKSGQERIDCLQDESTRLSNQSKTLSNQIAQYNAQINLATLKIQQTEEKIALLGRRIDQLEISLDDLTKAFASRAVETYKLARSGSTLFFLLTSNNLNEVVSRFHYLQVVQKEDGNFLQRLQTAQVTYKSQKTDQEELQKELAKEKANLDSQKKAKASLLAATKNDEQRYQGLIAEAIAQLNISKGLGTETFVRSVSEGESIGSLIESSSGCSSGRHLHFEVHKDNGLENPNNYLRNISFSYSYGSDLYGYFGTINPMGSWNWPLSEPIAINQGFGATGYARDFGYQNFVHPGIDMEAPSSQVKAVKPGKLYRGSINCGGKYPGVLTYAKVEQDSGVVIYYEHMYVQ